MRAPAEQLKIKLFQFSFLLAITTVFAAEMKLGVGQRQPDVVFKLQVLMKVVLVSEPSVAPDHLPMPAVAQIRPKLARAFLYLSLDFLV